MTLNFTGVEREGYTFLGWTTTPVVDAALATVPEYYTQETYPAGSGDQKILSGDSFDKDTVLYAHTSRD